MARTADTKTSETTLIQPSSLRRRISSWLLAGPAVLGLACGATSPAGDSGGGTGSTTTYRVTFNATWSASTHPVSFPPNPHFSGLIGGTHNAAFVMWEPGGLATTGIRNMAELGAKPALMGEVEAAIQAGTARSVLSGGGIGRSPGTVNLEFTAHEDYPLVSLVSMIAPSPDWFVGVRGLSLRENGRWIESITVDLLPYDAGTDSGTIYTSANAVTTPQETVRRLTEPPIEGNVPLGTFTFVRQ